MKTSEQTAVKATYFSIVGNTCLAIIKGIAGVFGNSYALIADAIESTTDIFASFLVLFGIKYSNRPADANHPYGHGRVEPLITFLVVGFLITSASIIAYESVINIRTPHELPKPWTLIVLGAIIIWKEFSFRLVMKRGIQTNSSSLKADAWHHRSDAITSVAAFIGISIVKILVE
jgi:cation diffusion facilitator family transporter